jgi:hypothetical protein
VRRPEYQEFFDVAKDNKIQIARLQSVDEIEAVLEAGRMVTIASTRGFRMDTRTVDGHHVFVPSGTWYHQMHFTDVIRKPIHAFYRGNQWGPDVHGKPLNGETPGGAWNLVEDVDRELRDRQVEVYAYFDFDGDATDPDLGIL